jgi:hypothetical protein
MIRYLIFGLVTAPRSIFASSPRLESQPLVGANPAFQPAGDFRPQRHNNASLAVSQGLASFGLLSRQLTCSTGRCRIFHRARKGRTMADKTSQTYVRMVAAARRIKTVSPTVAATSPRYSAGLTGAMTPAREPAVPPGERPVTWATSASRMRAAAKLARSPAARMAVMIRTSGCAAATGQLAPWVIPALIPDAARIIVWSVGQANATTQ